MDTADLTVHRSFIDLPKELFEMLATLGPYLYRDTVLLQKVHFFASDLLHVHLHIKDTTFLLMVVGCLLFMSRYVEY